MIITSAGRSLWTGRVEKIAEKAFGVVGIGRGVLTEMGRWKAKREATWTSAWKIG